MDDNRIYNTRTNEPQIIDHDEISWIINNGISHVKHCISAGFLHRERFVQGYIPNWVVNTENFYMKGIIIYNKILPRKLSFPGGDISDGKTIKETFNESSEYRALIIEKMCNTLYAFAHFRNPNFPVVDSWDFFSNFDNFELIIAEIGH